MSLPIDPIPQYDPLVDKTQHMGDRWYRWLSTVIARLLQSVLTVAPIHRGSVVAAITTATLFTPSQPGAYRVSWTVQIVTPASVSSSVAVTLGWKVNGIAQTETFAALTGNLTSTHGSGSVVIRPDSQPITYATAYASVGTPMAYALDVIVESVT